MLSQLLKTGQALDKPVTEQQTTGAYAPVLASAQKLWGNTKMNPTAVFTVTDLSSEPMSMRNSHSKHP